MAKRGYIQTNQVRSGRNAENVVPKDSSYIRCSRCGFMCSTDRDIRAPYGSRLGQGIRHLEIVEYDGGPDDTETLYDGPDEEGRTVSYDGYRSDFTITGGCPFCGIYTYDKDEFKSYRHEDMSGKGA